VELTGLPCHRHGGGRLRSGGVSLQQRRSSGGAPLRCGPAARGGGGGGEARRKQAKDYRGAALIRVAEVMARSTSKLARRRLSSDRQWTRCRGEG
jgi:hypothetical protein